MERQNPPFVILVGGKHGQFAGIGERVPEGAVIEHVSTVAEARRVLDIREDPDERDYRSTSIAWDGVELRLMDRKLAFRGRTRTLGPVLFALACELFARPGKWVTTEFLLAEVWEDPGRTDDRAVRKAVERLRKELSRLGCEAVIEVADCSYRLTTTGATVKS